MRELIRNDRHMNFSALRMNTGIRASLQFLLLLSVLLYMSSCARSAHRVVQPPKRDHVTASWYGPKFHGRATSSGEIFNMYDMTCAHKGFPFGTRLRVTNLKNGKSVVVTVNDRGPFVAGRDLDLSYAAAKEIGLVKAGVGRVRIEYLGRNMRYVKRIAYGSSSSSGPYTIQAGSFREKANADRLKQGLKTGSHAVYITSVTVKGRKFYRVRIGNFKNRDKAYSFAKTLADEGYSVFLTPKD
ncbi:MAG TPA: septal ring lytic transglycosylase RlpA family protein [Nitrospirae bacterium]|nr:septal ring lytic transglycosylase RlpA family protein [Nitrospirota bacterium]